MFTWVALAATAPGTARRTRAVISGVIRGQRKWTLAPDRRTPQTSTAACEAPASRTPQEAAVAAPEGEWVGSTVTRVQMLSRIGAPAESTKRFLAFSTPDRWA